MNLLKCLCCVVWVQAIILPVYAHEIVALPSLHLMAEPELRQETGIIAYQQDEKVRQALQHQVIRKEREIQNYAIDPSAPIHYDYQVKAPAPDLNTLPPFLQQHVMAIAQGLQSSDPSQGLYIMLQPLGIHRGNINEVRQGSIEIKEVNIHPSLFKKLLPQEPVQPPQMR